MKIGKVIGSIVATKKNGNLTNLKVMLVEYLNEDLSETGRTVACIDTVNAGSGDVVLLCSSSSARLTNMTKNVATDNSIVAIVDSVSKEGNYIYRKQPGASK